MKRVLLSLIIATGSIAMAREARKAELSPAQIAALKNVPQTSVILIDKNDLTKVQVGHVNGRVAPNTKIADIKANFQQAALDSEIRLIESAVNEDDARSGGVAYRWHGVGFGFGGYRSRHWHGYGHGHSHYPYWRRPYRSYYGYGYQQPYLNYARYVPNYYYGDVEIPYRVSYTYPVDNYYVVICRPSYPYYY